MTMVLRLITPLLGRLGGLVSNVLPFLIALAVALYVMKNQKDLERMETAKVQAEVEKHEAVKEKIATEHAKRTAVQALEVEREQSFNRIERFNEIKKELYDVPDFVPKPVSPVLRDTFRMLRERE